LIASVVVVSPDTTEEKLDAYDTALRRVT